MDPEYADLDHPRYDELVRKDLIFHHYRTSTGGALIIEHTPTKISRASNVSEMGSGKQKWDAKRAMIASIIAELSRDWLSANPTTPRHQEDRQTPLAQTDQRRRYASCFSLS